MKLRTKLMQIGVVGLVGSILIGLASLYAQKAYDKALIVSERNAMALRNHLEGDMMHDALRADVQRSLLAANEKDTEQLSEVKLDVVAHSKEFHGHIDANRALKLNAKAKAALESVERSLGKYISSAEAIVGLASTDLKLAHDVLPQFNAAFSELEEKMGIASDKLQEASNDDVNEAQAQVVTAKWVQALIIILSGTVSIFMAWKIAANITGQLGGEPEDATAVAKRIGNGDFTQVGGCAQADKTSLLGQLEIMRISLEESARESRNNLRIRTALDATSTNVMIANNDREIIYMNRAVENMLRKVEQELRTQLPHFSVDKVIGSNMDIFHKNPNHQSQLLSQLTATYTGNIKVASLSFRLIASPIFDGEGKRMGSIVEWVDRTQEVAVEEEIGAMVDAAVAGNFKKRAVTEGKQGFFLKTAEGLNALTSTADESLTEIARVLNALSKGDLTERITKDYSGTFGELKDYCNSTSESLSEIIGEIRIAAETIFTASSEIAQGNSDLSSRTEQQAANLEETASSMEELTSTVKLNADNAKQANVLAEQASSVATDGGELIGQVVTTMNAINESSQKIADIIGVIDGIAFQTNILALNAAVEAARAGDQGRGFAVVASEVRTLAQRSANAAKDIKALISDSVKKIENGNTLVGKSGDTMKEIVTAIKRVNDIMAEIAAASSEQSSGIEEVSTAVSQMDEMTQQNAALVEEAAAAAESLQSQADQMTQRVSQFRLGSDSSHTSFKPAARLSSSTSRPSTTHAKKLSLPKQQDDEWESF
ncbi:MAG TPA: methyl-accepting chemotaxis protein [Cellvibrio sp.]|nr:methyl-accepting chemotaxis protein [Cellvibrio sp.]